jgi:hypothetical protein
LLDRIYKPTIDYLDGDMMRDSDDYHGPTVDCFIFAKNYAMVVVLYCCNLNAIACSTTIMDGWPSAVMPVQHMLGIQPNVAATGSAVLELVRYRTDVWMEDWTTKLGKQPKQPRMVVSRERGPGHYVFVNRHHHPPLSGERIEVPSNLMVEAVMTQRQQAAAAGANAASNTNSGDQATSRADVEKDDTNKNAGGDALEGWRQW